MGVIPYYAISLPQDHSHCSAKGKMMIKIHHSFALKTKDSKVVLWDEDRVGNLATDEFLKTKNK